MDRYNLGVLPRITPIHPRRLAEPFDDPDWLFELKHDGYRCMAYIVNGKCRLVSRNRKTFHRFDKLGTALAEEFPCMKLILDGEIVCLDKSGHSMFRELMRNRKAKHVFYAFDLLWLNQKDLRSFRVVERKLCLERIIRPKSKSVLYANHIDEFGMKLFEAACKHNCEGIVAKHQDSIYAGRHSRWFKILNPDYSQKQGRQEMFEGFQRNVNLTSGQES
jgi:bifunctional non-homologous end joining protein LigD